MEEIKFISFSLFLMSFFSFSQKINIDIKSYEKVANDSLARWYNNAYSKNEIEYRKNSTLEYTLANDIFLLEELKAYSVPYFGFKKNLKKFKCRNSLSDLIDFNENFYNQIINIYSKKNKITHLTSILIDTTSNYSSMKNVIEITGELEDGVIATGKGYLYDKLQLDTKFLRIRTPLGDFIQKQNNFFYVELKKDGSYNLIESYYYLNKILKSKHINEIIRKYNREQNH